jgi:hypothetical protein
LMYHIEKIVRKFVFIFCVCLLSLSSCKQRDKEHVLRDIKMHIRIPNDYVQEVPKSIFVDAHGRELTDTEKRKLSADDFMKGVLTVSSTDFKNVAWFSLQKQTAKTGNFEQYARSSKDLHLIQAGQKMTGYDTLSSILRVSNIDIHKFATFSTNTKLAIIHHSIIYISSVKDYYLVVRIDYTDKTFAEEIEKAILTSTFK